jgi:hypothetical protein
VSRYFAIVDGSRMWVRSTPERHQLATALLTVVI